MNIGKINGGSAPNVVADYAEAIIELRTTRPNKETLKILIGELPKENIEILYNFEYTLLKNRFVNNLNLDKITVPYFTEMYFWAKKAKTIIFGPGKYGFAHSDNEKIRKDDLLKGQGLYLGTIKHFTNR